ncbi:MAG: N-formylglutamate amidohydrolase [Pseudomonadota bacterium]
MTTEAAIEAVRHVNAVGTSPVVLVCEHAVADIPGPYGDLGLSEAARLSHIAWDPGAAGVARRLAAALDARLVEGGVSRLIYDCNRPPEAPDAIPARSEIFDIPGNRALPDAERAHRIDTIYRPFHAALAEALAARPNPVLVTVHSFTPIFDGHRRAEEIGIVHDTDSRLADAMLADPPPGVAVARNRPYGPADGVTHTLRVHALGHRRPNVMLEIRNDLIASEADQARMAGRLAPWLRTAMDALHLTEGRA